MDCDFLIIGGGIAGLSAAARLAPLGGVVLWEAEAQLAYHASARSAALYEPHYGAPPVVALSLASGEALREAGVLSPRGLMLLAAPGEEAAHAAEARVMHLEAMAVDEALALVPALRPEAIAAVAHGAHAWDIDTDRLVQGCLREARGHGARVETGRRVSALARIPGGWRAVAGEAEVTARVVVNAAGAWADRVAVLAGVGPLGLVPHRRSMARIPAPGGLDVARWPMLMGTGETWYAKPDAGALIVSPADEDPMEPHDAWADDMVLAEGLARYEAFVTHPVTRVLSNWAGLRTKAPDGAMVVGFEPEAPGFLWLAGQGGQGFQTAPAAARLAADLIAGRAPELAATEVAALAPGRLRG